MKRSVLVCMLASLMALALTTGIVFAADAEKITEASIILENPEPGTDCNVDPGVIASPGAPYYVEAKGWISEDGQQEPPTYFKFEAGKKYKMWVTIRAEAGYEFPETVAVDAVNGTDLQVLYVYTFGTYSAVAMNVQVECKEESAVAEDIDISEGYTFRGNTDFSGDEPDETFFDGNFYAEEGREFTPKFTVIDENTGEVVPESVYDITYYNFDTKEALEPPFVIDGDDLKAPVAVVTAKEGSGYTGSFEKGIIIIGKHAVYRYKLYFQDSEGVEPVYMDIPEPKILLGYNVTAGKVALPDLDFYGRTLDPKYFTVSWFDYVEPDKMEETIEDPTKKLSGFPHKEGDYLFVVSGKAPYHGYISRKFHIVGSVDEAPEYPPEYDTGGDEPGPQPHVHSLEKTEAKTPTATEPGNTEYWTCTSCGKFFADSAGEKEIEKDSWIIPATGKQENTVKASGKTVSVKFAKLKKKAQTIAAKKAFTVKDPQGKVTYKVKTYDKKAKKKITVNASGKVTVKKGLKKGKYKLKVNVTAAGNDEYEPKTVLTTLTITVK